MKKFQTNFVFGFALDFRQVNGVVAEHAVLSVVHEGLAVGEGSIATRNGANLEKSQI